MLNHLTFNIAVYKSFRQNWSTSNISTPFFLYYLGTGISREGSFIVKHNWVLAISLHLEIEMEILKDTFISHPCKVYTTIKL